MRAIERGFAAATDHGRVVLAALVLATILVGAGLPMLETGTEFQGYRGDSVEADRLAYVESNFGDTREDVTVARVVVRDDDVLDRETLLATLELQRAIRADERVRETLVDDEPTVGLANVVATAAVRRSAPATTDRDAAPGDARPTLEEQIAALESLTEAEVEALTRELVAGDTPAAERALRFLPADYEPGAATADATLVAVVHDAPGSGANGQASPELVDAQTAIRSLVEGEDGGAPVADEAGPVGESAFVVGDGIVTAEQQRAQRESLRLLGPLALLFVLATLSVAYRDLVDVVLGVAGIGLVLVWTFGALGWLGIPFSPLFVAVPVLLIGLSIDYAIHVFMRYREAANADGAAANPGAAGSAAAPDAGSSSRAAMRAALPGVGTALVWVTLTTALGFLSHLASPVGPLRDLGLISAIGIGAALVVFGLLVPALKVELDGLLAALGLDRAKAPIGAAGSRTAAALSVGVRGALHSPLVVLLAVLLLTAGATYGATQVSTSFQPQDFLPGDGPEWAEDLPERLQPGEYDAREDLAEANDRFVSQDARAELLLEGDVAAPGTLDRVAAAHRAAAARDTTARLAGGEPDARSPLTAIRRVAERDPAFAATVAAADVDDDGIPDRDLGAVYDELSATAPDVAAAVLHREDGEYRALRLSVAVDDGATSQAIRADAREVAEVLEGPDTTATATGQPVVRSVVQDELLETLVASLLLTLLAVGALLAAVFRVSHGSATLGVVTVLPVAATVAWIVGTMTLLGIPLSVLTALVASLTVGIGVDYAIHLAERYARELRGGRSTADALTAAVTNTGAALLGSAVTTMGGFGVLALAVLPTLRQFGLVTALTVAYAFVASVVVLPSLLVVWTRLVGVEPRPAGDPGARRAGAPAAADD